MAVALGKRHNAEHDNITLKEHKGFIIVVV